MPVTVLIADASSVMRKAVRTFLNGRTDFAVVGEASNCDEAIQKMKDVRPHIVLLDLHLACAYEQPMKFRECLDREKIVAMTLGTDEIAKALAEHIGASVLIDKADLTTELIPLIVGLMQKSSIVLPVPEIEFIFPNCPLARVRGR
jgi:DNA-binding NarL/FixJ family response regulator